MRKAGPIAGIFAGCNNRAPLVLSDRRASFHTWQDRVRDPSLTALLVLELCAIFLAAPLAAKGLPIARAVVGSCGPSDRRDAVAQMVRHYFNPAGAGGHRGCG